MFKQTTTRALYTFEKLDEAAGRYVGPRDALEGLEEVA